MTKTAIATKTTAARKPRTKAPVAKVYGPVEPPAPAPVAQVKVTEGAKQAEAPVDKRPKVWCWISPQAMDRIRKDSWLGLDAASFRLDTRTDGGGSFLNPSPEMLDVLEAWAQQQHQAEVASKGPDRTRLQRLVGYAQKARQEMVAAGRF